ncbi:hypothetical protein BGZ63DRAFT_401023 [Mariannaea sp. PMI_226]|nr:hypothetical protein BGZ63DRAFT_401023 [Mariannaea sp. PMI_226]
MPLDHQKDAIAVTTRDPRLDQLHPHDATVATEAAAAAGVEVAIHLYEIFGQFGRVKDLDLPINRSFGTNRGTAYILYDYEADAEAAIAHMHEAQVDGATINVSIVLPRRKLSPAPPMARRGANIDPRVPFAGARGGPPGMGSGGNGGNVASGGGRRHMVLGRTSIAQDPVHLLGHPGPRRREGVGAVTAVTQPTPIPRDHGPSHPQGQGVGVVADMMITT